MSAPHDDTLGDVAVMFLIAATGEATIVTESPCTCGERHTQRLVIEGVPAELIANMILAVLHGVDFRKHAEDVSDRHNFARIVLDGYGLTP